MRSFAWVACLAFAACSPSSRGNARTTGGDGGTGDGGLVGTYCDDTHPCPSGQRCFSSVCIPDNGTCTDDNTCENDTYCDCVGGGGSDMGPCMGGVCVPYGTPPRGAFDPSCHGAAFSASDFKPPVQKCHWMAAGSGDSNVIMTPLVVDLDKDGKPEIVFVTQAGALVAIEGADCTEVFNKALSLGTFAQIAAADFDKDGFPELVAISGDSTSVKMFDHTGTLLATGTLAGGTGLGSECAGPAIADVDGDGVPEILVNGTVFRYTKGNATLAVLFTKPSTAATWGNVSLFADMDGDGKPEAVTGLQVYDGITGADKTPSALAAFTGPGGYPAIADFNGDGSPDIVNVQSSSGQQKLSIFDFKNNKVIFGPYTVASGGWGGTPTIGDYDGDHVPDIGFASSSSYYVYALKCANTPKPADCTGTDPGVLWQRTTRDLSSGGTGSSTFDFNGDGIEEVIYRDECWLRVYAGPNGKTIFAQPISSGTCLEYPVVADVDNDGHADIVVPSDNLLGTSCMTTPEGQLTTAWTGPQTGIYVFTDPMNRWMPSRSLWTAHTYHITEINDDLSVPASEPPSWKAGNDYRKNIQGTAGGIAPQSDYTGDKNSSTVMCTNVDEMLTAQICNRGTAPALPPVPGTFYTADPTGSGAMKICTSATTMTLAPGMCEAVTCTWQGAPMMSMDLWFRADDDGMTPSNKAECKTGNDLLFLPKVGCGMLR